MSSKHTPLFVHALALQTAAPSHRISKCWHIVSHNKSFPARRHRVPHAATLSSSRGLKEDHVDLRGDDDELTDDVLMVDDPHFDSDLNPKSSQASRRSKTHSKLYADNSSDGPKETSNDRTTNPALPDEDDYEELDDDSDETNVILPQRSNGLNPRVYSTVTDHDGEERRSSISNDSPKPFIPYTRHRRPPPDPHVASQNSNGAYFTHVANQQNDPTAAVWRRQNGFLVDEARRNGVDSAVNLLWELSEQGRAASQNFNQVVSLLSTQGRLQDGLELALEAGRRNFANIITFRPLMKLCCASGDGKAAKRVWKAMSDCGVEGDMFLYAELMGALVRSQDLSSAERVIHTLLDSGKRPHIVLYNTLLKGIAKQANVDHAFGVLDGIVEAGVKPDETTFNTILNTCVRAKDLDALNRAMDMMRLHRVRPGVPTFNTLLKLYARAGQFQDALDIFHEMQQTVEPSIVTYNTLIDGCAHRGDMDQAAVFFDEMLHKGMTPDICTMTSLLKGFGRSNNPDRAVELYEAMKEGGYIIEERTRYAVINACLRGNDRANAKRLMHEMIGANLRIRVRTWVWRLESDLWCDDEDAALETLREMDRNGVYMDAATKSAILREARERGDFLRFQRELKASKTSTVTMDRRGED